MNPLWPQESLASVLAENPTYGIVQPGRHYETGTPIVRVGDLREGVINAAQPLRVSPRVEDSHRRTRLDGGEVLLSLVGTVGESAIVPESLRGWNVARAIAVLRPASVSPSWLHLCLRSGPVQQQFLERLNTTVQSTLNLRDLATVTIPVPPLPEREAIEEVLGVLDDKIAANGRLVATADSLAAALVLEAASDQRVPLGQMASVEMGSSPPGESYNENGQGVIFYQGVRDFGVRYPAKRVWTTQPIRIAQPDDTLVSVRAPVGRTNMAGAEVCIGRGLAALRSISETPMTFFHLLRADPRVWAPYEAEGTVFGSINKKQLEALPVPTVDKRRADTLERQLAALELRIASALDESVMLGTMRDGLLPQLMSGRVRVKDAEKMIEGVV